MKKNWFFAVKYSSGASCLDENEMYWSLQQVGFNWNLYGLKTRYSDVSWGLNWNFSVNKWENEESSL